MKDTSYKELLKYKNYVFVLILSMVSGFGFVIFQVVLYWLAYKMSESTLQAAIVVQSSAVPYVLFGLVGGVYADSWNKKKIIIWNQVGTGFIMFTILISYIFQIESIWYIAIASFLIVTFRCFYSPAIRSLVSITLPEPLWPKGNSIFQLNLQLSRSLAPVVGGILIASFSMESIFFFFLILSFVPLVFVISLKVEQAKSSGKIHVLKELNEMFTFLQTKKIMFLCIVAFGLVLLFFTGMERLGLPIVSDQQWQKGAKGFSLILTLFAAGNAIGAILLGKIKMKSSYPYFIMVGCILWGFGLMGVGLSPTILIAAFIAFFTGVAEAFIDLPMVLMIQTYTPEEQLGKVFSALSTIAFIGEAGASFLAAFMIDWTGIFVSFIIMAFSILVICSISLVRIRKERVGEYYE
ncbi:MFS transporter [Bacillus sp. IITD106]|nr:MFS transporter [Bacillus sp. IITD106]